MRNVLAAVFGSTARETNLPRKARSATRRGTYTRDPHHYFRCVNVVKNLRYLCQKQGLAFNLDNDYLLNELPLPSNCPILGLPLDRSTPDHKPTLDRLREGDGFVKGNVRWVCSKALRIKENATVSEVEAVAKDMRQQCESATTT